MAKSQDVRDSATSRNIFSPPSRLGRVAPGFSPASLWFLIVAFVGALFAAPVFFHLSGSVGQVFLPALSLEGCLWSHDEAGRAMPSGLIAFRWGSVFVPIRNDLEVLFCSGCADF